MAETAEDYLRELSASMANGYPDHCVVHACRVAELLLAEGRAPWIGRLRRRRVDGERVVHDPLIPKRFPAMTWTTHYVACAGDEVFDPLAEVPVTLEAYSSLVFGQTIPVEEHYDPAETERLLAAGELRRSFRPK